MKNKMAKGIVLGLLITSVMSCSPKKEEAVSTAVDKEQIKKDIQVREDEFAAAYNSGEFKGLGYYADDAITFYQNKAPITNKDARLAFFKADLMSNSNKISFATTEVFPSSDGKTVLEIGHFQVSDSTKAAISTGNYMSLFEKRGDKYVCIRDMSASDMPIK
jgi:ketosteroid isomerase-like protein